MRSILLAEVRKGYRIFWEDLTRYDMIWSDSVRFDIARQRLEDIANTWSATLRIGDNWQYLTRFDKIGQYLARFNKIWRDFEKLAEFEKIGQNPTRLSEMCQDFIRIGKIRDDLELVSTGGCIDVHSRGILFGAILFIT